MSATTATIAMHRSKFPFTSTQWQELEHQALIYKYMAAGIPIPPDLLFSIKRSFDSPFSSNLYFPYQSTPLGWNPYQIGYGKKIDPEPGRCRRTDGKKWRCSKEAHNDSKYCERHMHRGKNRSRKPVESHSLTNNNNNISTSLNSATTTTTTYSNATVSPTNLTNQSFLTKNNPSDSLYSFTSSDSSYNSSTNAQLIYPQTSSFCQKDYRDEHAFFAENSGPSMRGFSGTSMNESWELGEKQSVGYPNYLQPLQSITTNNRDFNCDLSMKIEEKRSNLSEKTTHHFFDEWPIKTSGGRDDSSSTTQLSISIPSSASNHHDFFLSNSRNP